MSRTHPFPIRLHDRSGGLGEAATTVPAERAGGLLTRMGMASVHLSGFPEAHDERQHRPGGRIVSAAPLVSDESGQVLLLTGVLMAIFLVVVALVVDIGHARLVHRQLQAGVDAAALAGAQELPDGTSPRRPPTSTARRPDARTPSTPSTTRRRRRSSAASRRSPGATRAIRR